MAESRIFNLLKPIAPPETVWDKIYDWILGRARVVILITELLIVGAFVGKVVVDTTAKNKDNQIYSLQSELAFYTDKEPVFRDIQKRDTQYVNIWNKSSGYSAILDEIFSYIPNPGAQLTIRFDKGKVSILGYDDLDSLKTLETSLKNSKTFTNASVNTLSLEQKEVLQAKGLYILEATIVNPKREALTAN